MKQTLIAREDWRLVRDGGGVYHLVDVDTDDNGRVISARPLAFAGDLEHLAWLVRRLGACLTRPAVDVTGCYPRFRQSS